MSTTIDPPASPRYGSPQPPASGPSSPPPSPRAPRSSSKVIAILTVALGAAVAVGALVSSTVSTAAAAAVRTENRSIDASGVRDLHVEVGAAVVRVEFADVSEATLEVTSGTGADSWTLERDGAELEVVAPDNFGIGFGWLFDSETRATLTLPRELEGAGLDASLGLSAGDLTVAGDFGDLTIEVGAGSLAVTGSASTLSADVNAGGADIDLQGVSRAEFTVSAGTVDARLTGAPPSTVTVDVSAGALDLTLPDAVYDVRSDVSAGDLDNGLRTEVGSRNTVSVSVSAGTVTIDSAE